MGENAYFLWDGGEGGGVGWQIAETASMKDFYGPRYKKRWKNGLR